MIQVDISFSASAVSPSAFRILPLEHSVLQIQMLGDNPRFGSSLDEHPSIMIDIYKPKIRIASH